MDLNHYGGSLEWAGSSGCQSDAGDATSHVAETLPSRRLPRRSQRNGDYGTRTLGIPCSAIDRSRGTRVDLGRCCLFMVLVAILAIVPLQSRAQETQESERISVKEGTPARTVVPSDDESIPMYTVRARLHREGGLPLNWLANYLAKRVGNLADLKAGAELGGLPGVIVGGAAGWLGGKIGEYAGDEFVEDGRCGVDINVEAPSSLRGDWAYGGIWVVDIPFDFGGLFKPASSTFLSVAEAMPTTSPWDSREFVRAGSTLDITADDSLCYRASLDAEFEYQYDCDLYCDTTDPDAICPAHCRAFEMEFVRIPAGSFLMGSRELTAEERESVPLKDRPFWDEFPQQSRSVDSFSLGKYEVTQAQWVAVMGSPPRCFVEECNTCPVVCVSWNEMQEFIEALNERESESRYSYRLPTEAEWEYAARAGTTGPRYGEPGEIAWYSRNSGGRWHPVGEKRANAWGLHDMLGNVSEVTADWYRSYPGADYDFAGQDADGPRRVRRGGDWLYSARHVRSAYRDAFSPGNWTSHVGFRLVRTE